MLSDARIAELRAEWPVTGGAPPVNHLIHVLLDEVERLRSALSEYADESNWSFGEWMMPYKERWGVGGAGNVARTALGQTVKVIEEWTPEVNRVTYEWPTQR